jgi:Plasmid replication region DNA-binding N-term
MNADTVTEAVRALRTQGERISVRAVHQLTGGSFRDLSRILRDSRALADEEVADLDDTPEPSPPAPGRLAELVEAMRAVDQRMGNLQESLDATMTELASHRARRPPDTWDPTQVSARVAAQAEHDGRTSLLERTANQLRAMHLRLHSERLGLQDEHARVMERIRSLRQHLVPQLSEQVSAAQHDLAVRRRDAEHAIRLGETNVQRAQQQLAEAQRELAQLTGDAV